MGRPQRAPEGPRQPAGRLRRAGGRRAAPRRALGRHAARVAARQPLGDHRPRRRRQGRAAPGPRDHRAARLPHARRPGRGRALVRRAGRLQPPVDRRALRIGRRRLRLAGRRRDPDGLQRRRRARAPGDPAARRARHRPGPGDRRAVRDAACGAGRRAERARGGARGHRTGAHRGGRDDHAGGGVSLDAQATVLLVDDRPENLVALEAVLAPLGCRLVTATSGAEALKRLLEDEFAVILLDVQMPELDGFETAEYIKRRERTRHIPIIFVTAISKEEHHVFRGYETGAVDYVFKPYDPVVLRSKVQVFIDLWRASRALRASEALARATFDDAPIGMARMDRDGRIVAANRALCETLGVGIEQLTGRTIDELSPRSERGTDAAERAALLAGRQTRYEVERRLIGANGRAMPMLVSFAVARPAGSEPVLLAHVEALRERKRAERARELLIREQAARLEAEAVNERLQGIQRIADATLAPLALHELLGELLGRIAEVLAVDGASFVLSEQDNGFAVVQAAEGVDAAVRTAFVPTENGAVMRVMRERRRLIIDDTSQEDGAGEGLPGAAVSSVPAPPPPPRGRGDGAA